VVALFVQVFGLAPLFEQRETIDRMVDGVQFRSHFVIFNSNSPMFGQDRDKLIRWLEADLPEVDSHQLNHLYEIGTEFRGFTIWTEEKGLQAIRSHPWVKYVEEDQVVKIPDDENPYLLNTHVETMAPFTDRPDYGQVRSNQPGARNLATSPAGLYNGTTYPPAGNDTTSWDWTTAVYNTWRLLNTGSNAKIYILDTGVWWNHQEFVVGGVSRVTTRQNYATNNPADGDCNGHGTHCAGSAAGRFRGLATAAELGSVRVLNCQGSGTNADVVAGINFIAGQVTTTAKTVILSASLGGGASTTTDNAINSAAAAGVVPVVAAGNSNDNACNYSPARAAQAISVAASNKDDARASFSNYGNCTFVFAPGQSIHSSYYNSNTAYATLSGTSMATPLTSGAIAVYVTSQSSRQTVAQVKNAISAQGTRNQISPAPPAGTPNIIINNRWGQ